MFSEHDLDFEINFTATNENDPVVNITLGNKTIGGINVSPSIDGMQSIWRHMSYVTGPKKVLKPRLIKMYQKL